MIKKLSELQPGDVVILKAETLPGACYLADIQDDWVPNVCFVILSTMVELDEDNEVVYRTNKGPLLIRTSGDDAQPTNSGVTVDNFVTNRVKPK